MSEPSPLLQAQSAFAAKISFASMRAENVSISDALGRIVADDISAPIPSPPYSRAIVEGYLVRTDDTKDASESTPKAFKVIGQTNPGDRDCRTPATNEAVQVVTGSLVPEGSFSIVRQWEAKQTDAGITTNRSFPPRFFIEDRGCVIADGQIILTKGKRVTPWDISVLASLGITNVKVVQRPKVAIFGSGNEVIPFSSGYIPGTIYDCNSPMLAAAVTENGGTPYQSGIQRDDFDAFHTAIEKALSFADMILIAGGTAVGGRDFISDLLKASGELIVDGVPMKSGRPLIMGLAQNKPIVCVAGHPPEALRGFHLFGVLAMNRLLGQDLPLPVDEPVK